MKKLFLPAVVLLAAAPFYSQAQLPTAGKIAGSLRQLAPLAAARVAGSPVTAVANPSDLVIQPVPPPNDGRTVIIDAIAEGDPNALAAALIGLGAGDCAVAGRVVSASLPLNAISSLDGLGSLRFAHASLALANTGLVTSQGDAAMRAQVARSTYALNGTGVRVGILSDSFNALGGMASGITAGDLPSGIQILLDATGTDEGRAMAEIVHDVAPASTIAFYSVMGGQADFANGIRALKNAGCKVVVDDVLYLDEPMFADGIIAQAVDEVVAAGVPYFSAAGNNGKESYQAAFKEAAGGYHNFSSTNTDTVLNINFMPKSSVYFILQWADRYASCGQGNPGAATDLDLEFVHQDGTPWLVNGLPLGSFDNNIGQDPVEIFGVAVGSPSSGFFVEAGLKIHLKSGTPPPQVKLVWFVVGGSMGQEQYWTDSSTLYGHMNAAGAMGVGAAFFCDTPAFGVSPPLSEYYSALGGTPIYFKPDGTAHYEMRNKPDFTAPDGGNSSFFGQDRACGGVGDGYPNFSGTSAAAPHAAAVAALMLQAQPSATPAQVRSLLQTTAIDMETAGFDFKSGYGLVQADAALAKATRPPTASSQSRAVTEDLSIPVTLTGTDPNGFALTYTVVSSPAHGTLSGVAPSLVYKPALNYSGTDSFTFKVANGYASSAPATVSLTVSPVKEALSPPVLRSAVSRKTHGSRGTFDLVLPLSGKPGIECRIDSQLTLVIHFDRSIRSANAALVEGVATVAGSPTVSGSDVTVSLSSVADRQWLTVRLSNIVALDGGVLSSASVRLGVLGGDIDLNGAVSTTDLYILRYRTGELVSAANFLLDVDRSGALATTDLYLIRPKTGAYLPAW